MTKLIKNLYWKYIESKVYLYLAHDAPRTTNNLTFKNGIAEGCPELVPSFKVKILCWLFNYNKFGFKII